MVCFAVWPRIFKDLILGFLLLALNFHAHYESFALLLERHQLILVLDLFQEKWSPFSSHLSMGHEVEVDFVVFVVFYASRIKLLAPDIHGHTRGISHEEYKDK